MSKHAVEVKNIKKSFFLPNHKNNSLKHAVTQIFKKKDKGGKTFNALDGISFNVEKGDFFGVLGRNGSGKSTLLKIISDIYQPTSGTVKHNGKVVSFIELGVGFKTELSGRENVFLNGALLGFSKPEIESMYEDIVEFAELERFMDQKLKNYSSGMKVRLAFSVAIRAKADILILDEVLAVGDASFQKKCTDYFETLKNDKKTVILVTHSMGNVRKFCNKAIVIEAGKILYEGDANTAADEYNKLFKGKKQDKVLGETGTKEVVIQKVEIDHTPATIKYCINLHNKTNKEITVRLALDIYKSKNQLCGGISKTTHILKANQIKEINFSIANIFGSGEYSANVGIKEVTPDKKMFDIERNTAKFINKSTEDTTSYFPVIFKIIE